MQDFGNAFNIKKNNKKTRFLEKDRKENGKN